MTGDIGKNTKCKKIRLPSDSLPLPFFSGDSPRRLHPLGLRVWGEGRSTSPTDHPSSPLSPCREDYQTSDGLHRVSVTETLQSQPEGSVSYFTENIPEYGGHSDKFGGSVAHGVV